jgi:hypothetical protein
MSSKIRILGGYPATTIGVLLGAALVAAAFGNINVFDVKIPALDHIQKDEVDELVTALLLITVGTCVDLLWRRRMRKREAAVRAQLHQAEIQAQRLRVLKATMRTVQDIVGNFLQGMQLFLLDAPSSMSETPLAMIDDLIQDTASKLRALGNLESTPEREVGVGVVIDYQKVSREPSYPGDGGRRHPPMEI